MVAMLKKIAVAVVLILAAFAGFVATRPAEFSLVRSRTLAAPPEFVFGYVNDFHRWPEWSPWEKIDPAMKREFSGAAAGPGAAYYWNGNDKVGEGRMTITDSQPAKGLTIKLEFMKPFAATNTAQFDFAPSGTGTNVTWTMSGHNNFIAKAMCVFMSMEKMVGPDFEKGLAQLDGATGAALKSAPVAPPHAAPGS
jgi:hypothetical protein